MFVYILIWIRSSSIIFFFSFFLVPGIFPEGPMISVPSVRSFVRNAFSPSLMSQIFWNLVYSLSGVKVRECPSLFLIFAKFGPGGPKNGHFWPFFGHFCSFLDLKAFLESRFFLFFNMMFLGIFRSDLQKILKKGSNFEGLKNDVIFQIPQKLAWNLAPCFATKCSNHLWIKGLLN